MACGRRLGGSDKLQSERGIGFEDVLEAIGTGRTLAGEAHPNPESDGHQRILVVEIDGYACVVPYVQQGNPWFPEDHLPKPRLPEEVSWFPKTMKKAKHTGFDAPCPDDEERAVVEAAERGEFQAAPDRTAEVARWQAAAASTSKKKALTVRLQERDIQRIKAIVHRKGVPYQTLVSSVIHQYATGDLRVRHDLSPPAPLPKRTTGGDNYPDTGGGVSPVRWPPVEPLGGDPLPTRAPRLSASHPLLALRLLVLVENRADPPCEAAHGFCAWLETGGTVLLVDTGPDPGVLARNAARLGVDLGRVETVVLSHGHYDHTGGLSAVVTARAGRPLRVVLHPSATRARFSRRTGVARAIGMPAASQAALAAAGVTVVPSPGATRVVPGVWVTGAIPRGHDDNEDPHLVLDPEGHAADPLEDDQAVVVETTAGLTVLCGCAHAGVVNTLDHVARLRPGAALALLAGGLHLGAAPNGVVERLAAELQRRGVHRCAVGHCTGSRAEDVLAGHFAALTRLHCGSELAIP